MRSVVGRVPGIAILCGVPLLLAAILVTSGGFQGTGATSAVPDVPAAELGIGEIEMGPDFGRPVVTPERGPFGTALLFGVLLLCPAKFLLLWMLQRQESRQLGTRAGAPASGDA